MVRRSRWESRRWRRPDLRDEGGVTLVELVVVMAIMSLILGFVTRGLVSMQDASVGESYRLQNLDEARTLMNSVSRDLRTAARLSSTSSPFAVTAGSVPAPGVGHAAPYAGNTEVWFYANLTLASGTPTPCPDVVHLYVDTVASPPVLKEQTIAAAAGGSPPTCGYTGTYTTRLVGKYIANPAASPVFTYYYDDASGAPTAFPPPSTTLSPTDLLLVNAVGITLSIRQSNNFNVPYTTLINRVRLPNVDYNPIPDS
jgi:prepilin-type N-terminal cleavage/methylation domain-containing protein